MEPKHSKNTTAATAATLHTQRMGHRILAVTPYQQNCSLIWCKETNKAALIDPGGEAERLLRAIKTEGVSVEKILLTHGHLDHVGAAHNLAQQLDVPIVGPTEADAFWFDWLPKQSEMFSFPATTAFMPDQWLNDGDIVHVGHIKLAVIHCPGHTPGHIAFFSEANKKAFVGDIIFNGSIGRTDFPQGDRVTLINSIKNKLLPLGDDITFVPGHGPNSTFGQERLSNPFLNL